MDGGGGAQVDALGGEGISHSPGIVLVAGQDRGDAGGRSSRRVAEQAGVGLSVPIEGRHLHRLAALGIDDLEPVAGPHENGGDGASGDPVALHAGLEVGHSGHE